MEITVNSIKIALTHRYTTFRFKKRFSLSEIERHSESFIYSDDTITMILKRKKNVATMSWQSILDNLAGDQNLVAITNNQLEVRVEAKRNNNTLYRAVKDEPEGLYLVKEVVSTKQYILSCEMRVPRPLLREEIHKKNSSYQKNITRSQQAKKRNLKTADYICYNPRPYQGGRFS